MEVSHETAKNNTSVVDIYQHILTYCKVYSDDLEARLGLQKAKLPTALAISVFLNPFFGQKPKVIGSGLMTE